MEQTRIKPYVISADLETVNQEHVNRGMVDRFRESLTDDLTEAGKSVEWVSYQVLRSGVGRLIANTSLAVISLDGRYVDTDSATASIGVSRAINADLSDAGYDARLGYPSIEDQFVQVGSGLAGREVVVVDDVIFSGDNMCWTIDMLEDRGVRVKSVIAGVAIGEAAEQLGERGIELQHVTFYEDVDDEVCERDFALVEGSGRKVLGEQQSALYFDNQFGNPEQWASIPATHVDAFFLRSIERNRHLLRQDIPLGSIANFLGYDSSRTVSENLASAQTRLK